MKKILFACIAVVFSATAFAQLAWVEPEPTIATNKITIYVDLSKLDVSINHNKLLLENPGPFFIWTWKPVELPVGHPNVNGLGEKPWQNSNPVLEMSPAPDKGPKVYKFEMIPTEFYGVSASQVYATGLAFLVKPKNGGGYGEDDIKSIDIILPINPPVTTKGAVFNFPTVLLAKEITTVIYDNAAEKKPSMQNLPVDTLLFIHLKATAVDSITGITSTYEPRKLLQVLNVSKLKMSFVGDSKWSISMVLQDYFNFPPTAIPKDMEVRIVRENWASDDDTGGNFIKTPVIKFGCE